MTTTVQFIAMKIKVITTCHNDGQPGYRRLKESLDKFGYEYECIIRPFSFGHQLPIVRDWCHYDRANGATHILYTDAFDTLAFADAEEVISKFSQFADCEMLISCEKNCYPYPERAKDYPDASGPWRYVNGGGWLVSIDYFKELCVKENLNEGSHDQVWLMEAYLNNQDKIKLDNNCEIFQTIAFSDPAEWQREGERFKNIGTGTLPVFFHGNGHTDMDWL